MDFSKILIELLLDRPFFGSILSKIQLIEDSCVSTACTDGKLIRFNPEWTSKLTYYEQVGLMAHEAMHIAMKHHIRQGDREGRKWNVACDMAINSLLLDAGFQLPANPLLDDQNPTCNPRSAEEIYPHITNQQMENSSLWGEVVAVERNLCSTEEERVTKLIGEAYRRGSGSLSNTLQRLFSKIVAPSVPWQIILNNYISEKTGNDYSSIRYSRRHINRGLYLPALYKAKFDITLVMDTSGSIDKSVLSEMVAIIEDIRMQVPTSVRVVYCDNKIQDEEYFGVNEKIDLHPKGGGGTDFTPVFDRLAARAEEPSVLIYLTDGLCSSYPDRKKVNYPVIWVYLREEVELDIW